MKKRLVGAFVLIALAVIFVPMLLPSRSGPQSVNMKIPPEPSGAMRTRVLQVGPDSASAGSSTQASIDDPDHVATLNLEGHPAVRPAGTVAAASVETTTAPAVSAPASTSAASEAASEAKATPPATAKPAPPAAVARATPQALPGGAGAAAGAVYTVNLGIYSDRASAETLVANARKAGYTALATPETFHGKPVLRVRAGPFPDRASAEAARLKLKSVEHVAMTIDTGIVNQTGDAPASALAGDQAGAWAVQLAAFNDRSSANQLRDRLRGQGFDGYVDSVDTSKGTLWRVRAGPFATRAVAEATRGQIAQKLKIKGDIVTQQ